MAQTRFLLLENFLAFFQFNKYPVFKLLLQKCSLTFKKTAYHFYFDVYIYIDRELIPVMLQFEDISESKRKAKHDVCDFMIKFNEISSKTGADFVTQLITLYDEEVT